MLLNFLILLRQHSFPRTRPSLPPSVLPKQKKEGVLGPGVSFFPSLSPGFRRRRTPVSRVKFGSCRVDRGGGGRARGERRVLEGELNFAGVHLFRRSSRLPARRGATWCGCSV